MARPVRLVTPDEVPMGAVTLFRVSTIGPWALVILVGTWMVACAWVAWSGGIGKVIVPPALSGWCAFFIGVYWVYTLNDLRKAHLPAAWIAAAGPDGLYVNLRSYRNIELGLLNAHVALIPYSAMASARGDIESTDAAGEVQRVVELKLVGAEVSGLEQAVASERDGQGAGTPLGSMLWTQSPVWLEGEDALFIDFRARPGGTELLHGLSRRGVLVVARRPIPYAAPRGSR
jgi:hypothetical protein